MFSAAAGIFVIVLSLRLASTLTLVAHRRALQVLAAAAVILVISEVVGTVAALSDQSTFTEAAEEFVELGALSVAVVILYYLSRAEREEISPLRRFADVDELTGLSSRSFFDRAAERRIDQSIEDNMPLSCLVLDIDDFKVYNDSHGHGAGDEILRCVGLTLRECARADDLVSRYGGEEFVVLMNGDTEAATEVAERMRQAVQQRCVPGEEGSLVRPVTVSVGVAPYVDDEMNSLDRLVLVADAEMYRAKRTGKNRVSVFENR